MALYPLHVEGNKTLTTTSPEVITRKEAKDNAIIQSLLDSKLFNSWQEKGYSIKFEKSDQPIEDNTSLSRCDKIELHQHKFCFVMICEFDGPDRQYLEYLDRSQDAWNRFCIGLRYEGVRVEVLHDHCRMLIPADTHSWSQARDIYYSSVNNLYNGIRNIPYVMGLYLYELVQFEWRDEYEGSIGGGGDGGNQGPPDVNIQDGEDVIVLICDSTKTTLTPAQLKQLKNAFHELISMYPEMKAMINALYKVGFKLSFHIGPVTNKGYAQFKTSDQTITFINESSLTYEHLREEFFHSVQYMIYGNDMIVAKRNAEFEVKVMQDLLNDKYQLGGGCLGAFDLDAYKNDAAFFNDYPLFIYDIANGASFDENRYNSLFHRWRGYLDEKQTDYLEPYFVKTYFKSNTNP